jgi:hypothetical protein
MVSPLVSFVRPFPFYLVSQSYMLYLCMSLQTCAVFQVLYRVKMFQVPILVAFLVVKRVVGALAS